METKCWKCQQKAVIDNTCGACGTQQEDTPFYCQTCNKIIDEVNVDGYGFGDRMLEGVMYRVKNNNGKPEVIGVQFCGEVIDPKDDAYMHGLNNKHWNKTCSEYCEELDIAACPTCGDDVLVWGG